MSDAPKSTSHAPLAAPPAKAVLLSRGAPSSPGSRRVLSSVAEEAGDLRKNVRDAAKAVLSWVAGVVEHEGPGNLNDVLNRCLRPGADVGELNYEALAREVNDAMGISLSGKRVRTAVAHLRQHREQQGREGRRRAMKQSLEALVGRLRANHEALVRSPSSGSVTLRRTIALEVLTAVRSAASRLIERGYGEGIAETVDLDNLEGKFLDYVRGIAGGKAQGHPDTVPQDLQRLLIALGDYDGSAECDMRLVVTGSSVVNDLMGPDSLPGLMGQLNVLVAGRFLLESELYCAELWRLAQAAAKLHDDAETRKLLNWLRRLPSERRLPGPTRLASYCLNNAATHILERVHRGELQPATAWMDKAQGCYELMRQHDSGFRLVKATQVLLLTVQAKLDGDATKIETHFRDLGADASLAVLQDIAEYDSSAELREAAQAHAVRVLPQLKHQLIPLRP